MQVGNSQFMNWFGRNIPNFLSVLRIIFIIPFIFAVRQNQHFLAILTAAVIVLTDFLDGQLARAWNVTSQTGKILDPLADKICTALAAVSLVYLRGFPLWLFILIFVRDFLILAAGIALLKYKQIVPVSDTVGKITMGVIAACLLVFLFNIGPLKQPLVGITVTVVLASAISYGYHFVRVWRRRTL
jgi:CDP-diacylglycerol--glycerol-3-phosphate 3-phosphatidyltransferase